MARLRAPLWAWILTAFGTALFAALGVWQLHRAAQKQEWVAQFGVLDRQLPVELSAAGPAPGGVTLRRAKATGQYLGDRQLLADGQSHEGRPGYHVWTPLQLEGGGLALVNRGWTGRDVSSFPVPDGVVTVGGYWRALPEPGIRVATPVCEKAESFPAVVVYPTIRQVACVLGEPVADGILLLDPAQPGGYVREWASTGFPPERHYGYAVQWFGLGVTAVVLFVILNLKRNP